MRQKTGRFEECRRLWKGKRQGCSNQLWCNHVRAGSVSRKPEHACVLREASRLLKQRVQHVPVPPKPWQALKTAETVGLPFQKELVRCQGTSGSSCLHLADRPVDRSLIFQDQARAKSLAISHATCVRPCGCMGLLRVPLMKFNGPQQCVLVYIADSDLTGQKCVSCWMFEASVRRAGCQKKRPTFGVCVCVHATHDPSSCQRGHQNSPRF